MAKYKLKKERNKTNIAVIIVIIIFALIGGTLLLIGYKNEMLKWMKTFGIVLLVLTLPLVVFVIYTNVNRKIKDM